jgi:hypothetical protein
MDERQIMRKRITTITCIAVHSISSENAN